MQKYQNYTSQEISKHCSSMWRVAWADGAYTMLKYLKPDIGEETFNGYFKALCDGSSEYKEYFEAIRILDEETIDSQIQ